ncbi:hypothetical protein H6P81_004226 [Aristolochia fimbriata]|uniref:Uncharacterized protein n=1 Tax=Aristolochia fimbriata TaxID=158543 RepID=A0AAV7FFK7_ARIFI|nr:hypothetical protein H6P81_004226 [Aristolochia fimbriata]
MDVEGVAAPRLGKQGKRKKKEKEKSNPVMLASNPFLIGSFTSFGQMTKGQESSQKEMLLRQLGDKRDTARLTGRRERNGEFWWWVRSVVHRGKQREKKKEGATVMVVVVCEFGRLLLNLCTWEQECLRERHFSGFLAGLMGCTCQAQCHPPPNKRYFCHGNSISRGKGYRITDDKSLAFHAGAAELLQFETQPQLLKSHQKKKNK